jgi:hypothetical protein
MYRKIERRRKITTTMIPFLVMEGRHWTKKRKEKEKEKEKEGKNIRIKPQKKGETWRKQGEAKRKDLRIDKNALIFASA